MEHLTGRRAASQRRQWDTARRAGEDAAHRYSDWLRVGDGLTRCLEETRSFRGLPASGLRAGGAAAVVRHDERIFVALTGVHLIERRASGGRVVAGLFVPGLEQPTSVDVGALVVTDRRAVLDCPDDRHEWRFCDVEAVYHDPDSPWTALVVPDGRPVSGVFYGHADVHLVRFRLSLALAVHQGGVAALRGALQDKLGRHLAGRPPPPLS